MDFGFDLKRAEEKGTSEIGMERRHDMKRMNASKVWSIVQNLTSGDG